MRSASSAAAARHSDGASIADDLCRGAQDTALHGLVLMAPHFIVGHLRCLDRRDQGTFETTDLKPKLARWHKRRRQRLL